jgi:hypothetical protein
VNGGNVLFLHVIETCYLELDNVDFMSAKNEFFSPFFILIGFRLTAVYNNGCFTRGGTPHFVNNSDTNKDIATKF